MAIRTDSGAGNSITGLSDVASTSADLSLQKQDKPGVVTPDFISTAYSKKVDNFFTTESPELTNLSFVQTQGPNSVSETMQASFKLNNKTAKFVKITEQIRSFLSQNPAKNSSQQKDFNKVEIMIKVVVEQGKLTSLVHNARLEAKGA